MCAFAKLALPILAMCPSGDRHASGRSGDQPHSSKVHMVADKGPLALLHLFGQAANLGYFRIHILAVRHLVSCE
jgi:hypothetical protein